MIANLDRDSLIEYKKDSNINKRKIDLKKNLILKNTFDKNETYF